MAEGFGLGLEAFRGFERPQKRTQCMYLGKSKSPVDGCLRLFGVVLARSNRERPKL